MRQFLLHNQLLALVIVAVYASGCTLTANDLESASQTAALADKAKPGGQAGLIAATGSAESAAALAALSAVADRKAANGLPAPYASPRRATIAASADGRSTNGKPDGATVPAALADTTPAKSEPDAAVVTALVDPTKAAPSAGSDPAAAALAAATAATPAPVIESAKLAEDATLTADQRGGERAESEHDAILEAEAQPVEEPAPPPVHIATIDEIIAKARADVGSSGPRFFSRTLKTYGTYAVASANVDTSCFPNALKAIFRQIYRKYGAKPEVNSGFRNVSYNRRVGGAHRSYHTRCEAADITVPGVDKYELARFLRGLPDVGGVGVYSCKRIVHVDVGPRRDWNSSCRRSRNQA